MLVAGPEITAVTINLRLSGNSLAENSEESFSVLSILSIRHQGNTGRLVRRSGIASVFQRQFDETADHETASLRGDGGSETGTWMVTDATDVLGCRRTIETGINKLRCCPMLKPRTVCDASEADANWQLKSGMSGEFFDRRTTRCECPLPRRLRRNRFMPSTSCQSADIHRNAGLYFDHKTFAGGL